MAEIPGLATFHQQNLKMPDSFVNNEKPLAPCIKRDAHKFNGRERDLESPSGSQESSANKTLTRFVDPLEFLIDNQDGTTKEIDNREKPTAPSFESFVKSDRDDIDERGEEENDRASGAKNINFGIYPDDCSPGNCRGNDPERNNSRNERSRDSKEKHFRGFDTSSDFPNPWRKPENINVYATKKTIAQGMLDVALLAANATQLKNLLVIGEAYQFYIFALTLVCLSIALQIVQGLVLIVLGSVYNLNRQADQSRARLWNDISLAVMLLTVIINVVVASFALQDEY